MSKSVDFYYDYISPASYLAWTQLAAICEKAGASINYHPVLLGGLFKNNGNTSPATIPAKWQWMQKDFARHAEYYGVPYQMNPHFIFSTVTAMRGAIWAASNGKLEEYNKAMFTAAWAEGKDLSSPETLVDVLQQADLPCEEIIAAVSQPEVKQALIQATEAAMERGVFGAPTFFVEDEIYFGQDRLDWVERALS